MKKERPFVTSISYPRSKEELMDELQVIAIREKKSQSELILELIEDYVKAHSAGNPNFTMDNWEKDPGFQAVPSILNNDWQVWKKYLEECDKKDFFKVLRALTRRREQAIAIMNQRNLKWEDSANDIRYVVDKNVTSHYIPMSLGDK